MASLNSLSKRDCQSPMKELLLQFYLNDTDTSASASKPDKFSDLQENNRAKTPTKTSEIGDTASSLGSEDNSPSSPPTFRRQASTKESALGTSASQSLESARSEATVVEQLGSRRDDWSTFPDLQRSISEKLKQLGKPEKEEEMNSALDASKLKLLSCRFPADNDRDDNESILTEDFVNKFNELVPKDDSGISSVRTRMDSASTKRSRPFDATKNGDFLSNFPSDPTPRFKALKAPRSREPIFANDSDSMVTEDFESNFRNLLFKGPPTGAEDTGQDSSDMNTARSSRLRERVSNLFHVPQTRVKLGDDSHSDTETDYVNRKFNEIMERRRQETNLTRSQSIPASPKLSNLRKSAPVEPIVTRNSSLKHEVPKVLASSGDPKDDEYRTEIRLNSLRIKRELEKERKSREASPKRALPLEAVHKPSLLTPRQTLDRKVEEIDELTHVVKRARGERDNLLTGLREMQETLRKNAAEVRFTEKWVKENRMKAEDVRQELMMAEMKRERTSQEVSRLNDDCVRKRMEVAEVESQLRQRVREVRELERQGINRDELEAVMAERNELLQVIRANEETEYQKYELEKLLTMAREDLAAEQQKNREKHIILEEELEASMAKITEMRREKESMRNEASSLKMDVERLEGALSQTEQEKQKLRQEFNEFGRNKAEEFERVRSRLESDMAEIRSRQSQEEAELHRDLRQSQETVKRLNRDLESANLAADDFRRQVTQLSGELALASDQKARLLSDSECKMRDLQKEKMEEIEQVRLEMEEQQSQAMADFQNQVDRDRHLAIQSMEDQYRREIEEFKVQLKIKEEEAQFLQERLHRAETERRRLAEESQTAVREHVREAVARERKSWEHSEEKRWRSQLTTLKENAQRGIEQLERTAAKQQETIQSQNAQIADLRKAVEEEQGRVKAMTKERQGAIARVKELAAEERARDIEKMRERLAKDTELELQKLRAQVQSHRENLETVMHDRKSQEQHEEELRAIAERLERTVVSEINEECRKMAEVLGINARHVDITEFAAQNKGSALSSNPVTASLANMEACGEELRSLLLELRSGNEESRRRLGAISSEREAELDSLRQQLSSARGEIVLRGQRFRVAGAAELQRMQTQLHEREEELRRVRRSMQKWKTETAEEIATNIQTEFNRVGQRKIKDLQASLLEREHEIQRLQSSKAPRQSSGSPDPSAARLIGHLQEQVKTLRKENLLLHKRGLSRHTGSTGDLSNGHLEEATHSRPGSRNSLRKNATNV